METENYTRILSNKCDVTSMTWWFRPISLHSKSYADNGVAGHVSNCKLMFSSETEDLNTKMFAKTMNIPVNNLA